MNALTEQIELFRNSAPVITFRTGFKSISPKFMLKTKLFWNMPESQQYVFNKSRYNPRVSERSSSETGTAYCKCVHSLSVHVARRDRIASVTAVIMQYCDATPYIVNRSSKSTKATNARWSPWGQGLEGTECKNVIIFWLVHTATPFVQKSESNSYPRYPS